MGRRSYTYRPPDPLKEFGDGDGRWRLMRDKEPDAVFKGELVGWVSSGSEERCREGNGLWSELYLFRIADGRLLLYVVGRSEKEGHFDRYRVSIYKTEAEMLAAEKRGRLTQALYDECGIDDVEEV